MVSAGACRRCLPAETQLVETGPELVVLASYFGGGVIVVGASTCGTPVADRIEPLLQCKVSGSVRFQCYEIESALAIVLGFEFFDSALFDAPLARDGDG